MDVLERWTIYVCSGCGGATGRHKDCDALREAVDVVPAADYDTLAEQLAGAVEAIERAHQELSGSHIKQGNVDRAYDLLNAWLTTTRGQ